MLTFEQVILRQDNFALGADLSVPEGARVAIIGPSGAGKSTLLNAIAGFQPVTEGRITWGGADLAPLAPGARPVSMLFQDQNLFPHMTVAQNVALGLRPDLRLSATEKDAVDGALMKTGLSGFGVRRPAQLSGGQASRVALARCLLRERPLLLLDEPFAALGPGLKAEMLEVLRTLLAQTGMTLLMVSHDPSDAVAIAEHVIFVDEGRAHPPVATAHLLADPPPALAAYLGKDQRRPRH